MLLTEYPLLSVPLTHGIAIAQLATSLSVVVWVVSPQFNVTAKLTPLLATPPTVTITFPVVAPVGTVATTLVALQLVTVVAGVPLNVTVLLPWLAPKFVPAIVTNVPTGPDAGLTLVIVGGVVTV